MLQLLVHGTVLQASALEVERQRACGLCASYPHSITGTAYTCLLTDLDCTFCFHFVVQGALPDILSKNADHLKVTPVTNVTLRLTGSILLPHKGLKYVHMCTAAFLLHVLDFTGADRLHLQRCLVPSPTVLFGF